MMRRLHPPLLRLFPGAVLATVCGLALAAFSNGPAEEGTTEKTTFNFEPPALFSAAVLDTVPNDTLITGKCDFPPKETLRFIHPSLPDTVVTFPVDSSATNGLMGEVDYCMGDTIWRIWRDTFPSDMSVVADSQRIVVAPDTILPVSNFSISLDTVVHCTEAADAYDTWLSNRLLTITSNRFDCSGIDEIDHTGPGSSYVPNACDTVEVAFFLIDSCGNYNEYIGNFITIDTVAPVLQNVPDSLSVSCDTLDQYLMNNPSSAVTVDDCEPNLMPVVTLDTMPVPSQCSDDREFNLRRTWTATDACGNTTEAVQLIRVEDRTAPTFTPPPNITIACDDDPNDLTLTGMVTDTSDNCGGPIDLFYNDEIVPEPDSCDNFYFIRRQWTAEDACDNGFSVNQIIRVADRTPPSFLVPPDTTVNCGEENDLAITGEPSMLSDNCSVVDSIQVDILSEDLIAGSCENDYIIERTWSVSDECGNDSLQVQRITVIDTIAPALNTPASDLVITCMEGINLEQAYSDWIDSHGGAVALDLCTIEEDLEWQAFLAGTNQVVGGMPAINCPAGSDTLFQQTVDFVVDDGCGNASQTQASFLIIDNTAPAFQSCPNDTIIGTDSGQCTANFTLDVPFIREECSANFRTETLTDNAAITSDAAPGQQSSTPVNPVNLSFSVTQPLPVNANGNASLFLSLSNADAESPTEFFRVFGEDGTLLGRTATADISCGNSDTTLLIAEALIDQWAVDGTIELRLEPNVPPTQPGSFAINAICTPQGEVSAELSFELAELVQLNYTYRIDDGARLAVDPVAPVPTTLPLGSNRITYYVEDCAGNTDSCSYTVLVEDREPPQLDCPDDIIVQLDTGNCSSMVTLPLPDDVIDNCGLESPFERTLPADTASAWLTFSNDPNLNDYIANPQSYTFNGVAANALGTVVLTLDFRGDFDTPFAQANIVADGLDTLSISSIGAASCNNPGQVTVMIPAEDFNSWAEDGAVTFTLEPVFIEVPPGGPGDGINPCDPAVVDNDGEVDSLSYVFMSLNYQQISPSYYAEGATALPFTSMSAPAFAPEHEFSLGDSEVSYVISDAADNPDTCSYQVRIEDNEPPVARCKATFVPINPSGLDVDTVQVADFDDGSFDNCALDTMFLSPNTFGCDQAGTTVNATLTVVDESGNTSTCTNLIRIEAEAPEPSFSPGICGGDTLYLFANPPPAEGGIVYSYEWRFDGQLISTEENPVLPNVDQNDAGAYVVTIEGITGCMAEGVVIVDITDQPLTSEVQVNAQQCAEEDIVLTSSFTLTDATYYWYEGQAPNGSLLQTTESPTLTIPAINVQVPTTKSYYLVIESNGCFSDPSPAKTVQLTPRPEAIVNQPAIAVCEGGSFSLGTSFSGSGITYEWTGPDGFTSNLQYPPTFTEAEPSNNGAYELVVTRNGCSSDPAFTFVTVTPRPSKPVLPESRSKCEGDTLTVNTLPEGATIYEWVAPDLSIITTSVNQLVIPDIDEESDGTWRVTATQFGCPSEESNPMQVDVFDRPQAMVMAEEPTVCERGSLELMGSPNLQNAEYRWNGPNGYMSFDRSPTVSNMSPQKAGQYTFEVTTNEGCSDTASIDVSVIESVDILGVSNSAPSCMYGPTDVNFQATVFPPDPGDYTYEWTGPGFSSNESVAVLEDATGIIDGNEYSLIVYTKEGCPSLPRSTEVETQDAPQRLPAPSPVNTTEPFYCVGDEITMSTAPVPQSDAAYIWSTPQGQESTANSPELTISQASLDDSGEYQVFVIVDGCSSLLSSPLEVTVHPIPSVNAFSNSPVCEGQMLQLFANSGAGSSYEWSGPIASSLQNPTISSADSMLHTGTYQVVATRNGCTSSPAIVEVEVNETPATVTQIDNNSPVCVDAPGATLALTAGGASAEAYYWYLNGEALDTTFSPNLLFNAFDSLSSDAFDIAVEARIGDCVSDPSPDVEILLDTIPDEVAVAGQDTSACSGEPLELYAQAPQQSTGLWTALNGNGDPVEFSDPTAPNTAISGFTGDNDYLLSWSLSNGACQSFSTDTLVLSVDTPVPAIPGNDTLVCAGEPLSLSAAVPPEGTGQWSQSEVQQDFNVQIDEPSNPQSSISGPGLLPGNTYAFTWTVESQCGADSAQVFVSIADNAPSAGMDQIACNEAGTAVLQAAEPADGSSGRWSSPDDQLVFTNRNNTETTVANLAEGINTLVWSLDEGLCGDDSRDTVLVDYQMPPLARDDQASAEFAVETQVAVLANDEAPAGSVVSIVMEPRHGTARVIDGTIVGYTPSPDFIGEDELVYEICREGCACDEAVLRIRIGEEVQCDAPNIISPNNDGVNDAFIIPCLLNEEEYPNSQLMIFNRWGDEVYRSPVPYPNDWEGTFNGADLPVDTYFYVLKLGDGSEPLTGFLLIQR